MGKAAPERSDQLDGFELLFSFFMYSKHSRDIKTLQPGTP